MVLAAATSGNASVKVSMLNGAVQSGNRESHSLIGNSPDRTFHNIGASKSVDRRFPSSIKFTDRRILGSESSSGNCTMFGRDVELVSLIPNRAFHNFKASRPGPNFAFFSFKIRGLSNFRNGKRRILRL